MTGRGIIGGEDFGQNPRDGSVGCAGSGHPVDLGRPADTAGLFC